MTKKRQIEHTPAPQPQGSKTLKNSCVYAGAYSRARILNFAACGYTAKKSTNINRNPTPHPQGSKLKNTQI